MKTVNYRDLNYPLTENGFVALGCFDGVHKGHAKVISTAVEKAKEKQGTSIVFCFSEPPKNYFSANSVKVLTDMDTKARLIEDLAPDILVYAEFNKEFADMSAHDFVTNILSGTLSAKEIFCGDNYTFGKNRSGNTRVLQDLCTERGIIVNTITPVVIDGLAVSSSAIRNYIHEGNYEKAEEMLGHEYDSRP